MNDLDDAYWLILEPTMEGRVPAHIVPEKPGLHTQSKLPDDVSMQCPSLRQGFSEQLDLFSRKYCIPFRLKVYIH